MIDVIFYILLTIATVLFAVAIMLGITWLVIWILLGRIERDR